LDTFPPPVRNLSRGVKKGLVKPPPKVSRSIPSTGKRRKGHMGNVNPAEKLPKPVIGNTVFQTPNKGPFFPKKGRWENLPRNPLFHPIWVKGLKMPTKVSRMGKKLSGR